MGVSDTVFVCFDSLILCQNGSQRALHTHWVSSLYSSKCSRKITESMKQGRKENRARPLSALDVRTGNLDIILEVRVGGYGEF